jgi:gas vesicle protein
MAKNSNVFLGIVTAAAVGAVIGMLFAPDKGTDFRHKISGNINDWADDFLNALSRGKDEAEHMKNKWGNEVENLKNEAKKDFENMKEGAKSEFNNLKNKAEEKI